MSLFYHIATERASSASPCVLVDYARLRDGGLVSYWLPVNQIELKESKAIVNAFCEIFPD